MMAEFVGGPHNGEFHEVGATPFTYQFTAQESEWSLVPSYLSQPITFTYSPYTPTYDLSSCWQLVTKTDTYRYARQHKQDEGVAVYDYSGRS